tara:strand:+ start:93 stop:611 length:519 start_codon:yes stop_codon:yes gene_type:complete
MVGCIAQHPIYKNYGARENGIVMNLKYWRILKPSKCKRYLKVELYGDQNRKQMLIHRFVYECFKGNIPDGLEIDHIDNNKHNNHIDNLQAITHKENMQKMSRDRKCKVLPTPTLLATCLNTGQQESFVDVFVASEKLKIDFRDIFAVFNKQGRMATKSATGFWFTFESANNN